MALKIQPWVLWATLQESGVNILMASRFILASYTMQLLDSHFQLAKILLSMQNSAFSPLSTHDVAWESDGDNNFYLWSI